MIACPECGYRRPRPSDVPSDAGPLFDSPIPAVDLGDDCPNDDCDGTLESDRSWS